MKKIAFATICIFLFVAVFSFSAAQSVQAKEKKILLKVPIAFATVLPGLGDIIVWIRDKLAAASGGSLVMKVYEPGKLVAPFEILDAVSSGKINAGYAASGYWEGKMPGISIFTAIPFGPEAPEFISWMFYGNGLKLYQEYYDQAGYNVKVLPACILSPETSGWFHKPIESVADLKGLRMRFFGLGGMTMEKLGVSVSLLPGGEIFAALEKKAIDATEFSMPAIDQRLGFYKIAKYNYYPGWHQQATYLELLINKDVWNSMSPQQQATLEMVTMAGVTYSLAETEAIQGKVIKENIEKRGVTNMYWSDEMLAEFKKAWEEVAADLSQKSPMFKKTYDDLQAFRKDYAYWSNLAFLPRGKK
ncbi:MAG TPA: TRAP transporter substrate-binding protein [Desulfobacterales bacterium]|nr:TRAP transporter substrate-binding protein [Desulfobacterales bacterium]